ncbi:putative PurR-regulated permease PerM [Dysgonomonadaceae bacterium PH5-43]|nr:putative PurR-regulated permease PerM [Dysgonomonadaceae bacterium PH5-43]
MYTGKLFNESIKQIGLLLIILFLACLIVGGLQYFISSVLGGFTLYLILRKPQQYLLNKGWNNTLVTSFLLLITFAFLILVVGGLIALVYSKLQQFHPKVIVDSLYNIHGSILERWEYDIFSEDVIQKALATVGNIIPGILSTTGNVVANVGMMIFILFFMLQQSTAFEKGIENLIPVSRESISMLKTEVHNMTLSNAVGIPLIMIGQGVTAGLAYWLLDAGDPVVWGLLTGIFGLIPVVGTGGVWLPLALNLLIGGNIWQGIVLAIYGALIISSVDNLVRMVFLKKAANVHPLVTLFGVILGMKLFGFWGIIFGPLLISCFMLLIKIYKKEFVVG